MEYTKTDIIVYETKDYEAFNSLLGNRMIDEKHVKHIMEKIQMVGLRKTAVLVNKNMEVIDGQHRIQACKKLNLPVRFIIDEEADINTCISLNINNNTWKLNDFIYSYAMRGIEDYQFLVNKCNHYPYLTSITIAMAYNNTLNNTRIKYLIRNGDFKITEQEFGDECLRVYDSIQNAISRMSCKRTILYYVLQGLISLQLIDVDRMIESINKYCDRCGYIGDVNSALDALQEMYNYHRKGASYFKDEYNRRMIERSLTYLEKK